MLMNVTRVGKTGLSVCFGLALIAAAGCGSSRAQTADGGPDVASGDTSGNSDTNTTDGASESAGVLGPPQKLVILHTNDIHSHLEGFGPEADYTPSSINDDSTVGGMARLATAVGVAHTQAGDTPVMLLDAGDFMMGTLFELLATSSPPELSLMKALGYDATTIGNHELDWTPSGLAGLLNAAVMKGITIPILASNMHFAEADTGDDVLKALVDATHVIQPKLVKTYGTLKVGFFGLLGADAVRVTPQSAPLKFDAIDVAARAMVQDLRQNDKVDLVIALSHSGISSDGTGEDADLAMKVSGIDIIISGHTHDKLDQPKLVNKTLIVTAGAYGQYLGQLEVTVTPGAPTPVAMDKYTLIPIDDTIMGDASTEAAVQVAITGVDNGLGMAAPGLSYKHPVAQTSADLTLPTYQEGPVGNLVTDAYRKTVAALQPTAPPVIAVEANGQLRAPILKGTTGKIWFEDMFRVLPIGIGPDKLPGYPLVTFYLTAKDIRSGLELDAAGPASGISDQFFLQVSGIKATYDGSKPLFNRITSLTLDGSPTPLNMDDTTACYKVVATNYVAGLLGLIKTLTSQLLTVTAKDADCVTPIDPTLPQYYVDAVPDDAATPASAGTQELKHWQALLKYLSLFPDTDDADTTPNLIPNVPAAYAAPQGRIVKQ